jgi:SAM-dependent methyltransferase
MSGFSAEWLALREPWDHAARSTAITDLAIRAATRAAREAPRVVDLGCGTGSNVRYLAARFAQPPAWRLVDYDAAHLASAAATVGDGVETVLADLGRLDASMLSHAGLVTASALLDLVSERWLAELVRLCADASAPVLFALSYDGRTVCAPHDADDALVVRLVNAHQQTDKGFGPALGPDASGTLAALLHEAGYEVHRATSDWHLDASASTLQRALIDGWAQAACELSPADTARVHAWRDRRLAQVTAGTSRIVVGHEDVAGIVPTRA